LKFDNIFVAIPRRSIAFLLLLQCSLVIWINLVNKFTRHIVAELRLHYLLNDMYRKWNFWRRSNRYSVPCATSTSRVLHPAWSNQNMCFLQFCEQPQSIATNSYSVRDLHCGSKYAARYRMISIPSVLYAAYSGSSINKSSGRTEHAVELIYSRNQRTCTNLTNAATKSVAKLCFTASNKRISCCLSKCYISVYCRIRRHFRRLVDLARRWRHPPPVNLDM